MSTDETLNFKSVWCQINHRHDDRLDFFMICAQRNQERTLGSQDDSKPAVGKTRTKIPGRAEAPGHVALRANLLRVSHYSLTVRNASLSFITDHRLAAIIFLPESRQPSNKDPAPSNAHHSHPQASYLSPRKPSLSYFSAHPLHSHHQ